MNSHGIERFISRASNKIVALEIFGESKYLFLGAVLHELIIFAEATLDVSNETVIRNLEIINSFIKPLKLIITDSRIQVIQKLRTISQEKKTPLPVPVVVPKIKEKKTPVKQSVKKSNKPKEIYAITSLGEQLKEKYEIKDFTYPFGYIKTLKSLTTFSHEMKVDMFINKNDAELEKIIYHLIGGTISSPAKDADITLRKFYQTSRTLLSNCLKIAKEFQAAEEKKPKN